MIGRQSDNCAGLRKLQTSIDGATKLVDKLLSSAKVLKHGPELAPVSPAPIPREAVVDLAPDAIARHQELSVNAAGTFMVLRDEHALGIMVRNLVENAMK